MPDHVIKFIPIDDLHLDPQNPRLPKHLIGSDEPDLLEYIATTTAIEDLMNAIAENGYFPGEPVVAYVHDGKHVIIEGNRRLTAVKLLQNPHIIPNPSNRLIEIASEALHRPVEIPVVVSDSRKEVLPYLGFRHITGVKQWDPLAKARYIKQLWDTTDPRKTAKERYKDVAQMIGSRTNHVKRSLDALAVYEIIEENDFYEIDGLDGSSIKFAVLATALADEPISNYTGIVQREDDGSSPHQDPIIDKGSLNTESIEQLTRWLFQRDENGKATVAESREIRKLAHVVDNQKALNSLINGSSLSYAYRLTTGAEEEFLESLYEAQMHIEKAAALVANVEYNIEAVNIAREIKNNATMIGMNMINKQEADNGF